MRFCRMIVASQFRPPLPRRNVPFVKICGIRTLTDAKLALQSGADLLGMILWQKSRRSVSIQTASEIVKLTQSYHRVGEMYPKTVGVFVEEQASEIQDIKFQTGIDLVQLHGQLPREALAVLNQEDCPSIYVLHVDQEGQIQTPVPSQDTQVEFVLLDGMKGGSGVRFPTGNLTIPSWMTNKWFLAGGLSPENVTGVLSELHKRGLHPIGVDVSSGVCDETGLDKDPHKIKEFIKNSRLLI
eukprot:g1427.t1